MSAAAVGADLRFRMEMEELELYTCDRFVDEFANLIAGSVLTYEDINRMWRNRRAMLEEEAQLRYTERLRAWVPSPEMTQPADLSTLFGGSQGRAFRILA